MLKNPEEGISYSLITSIYFPLLLKELNCKKEKKKKIRKNSSSLFHDNLGSNNESNMFFLTMKKSVGLTVFLVLCLNGSFSPAYSVFHKHHSKGCIAVTAASALSSQLTPDPPAASPWQRRTWLGL